MSNQTFKERVDKNHVCPKCKSVIIFIHGGGWDYDVEYCSSRNGCDYEVEYETTTDIKDDTNDKREN